MKWQDYLKSDPPRDDVLTAIISILLSLVSTTIVTIVKGIVLYNIHDFYEGVRQQGTMATQGLLDTDDLQKQQQQPNVVQVVQVMPGAYPGGGVLVMGAPIAPGAPQVMTAQGVQIDGQTFVPYPPAGSAAYPGGMLFVPHPPPR
ncbi:uncharacterized protein LOC142803234 [Rhipicephalus microplus]|uniref:uncharacterized protein LOC142803234 n=1 Tax=Rhipicephalus microplus TaxID=6941 RepID=UPI003F6C633E